MTDRWVSLPGALMIVVTLGGCALLPTPSIAPSSPTPTLSVATPWASVAPDMATRLSTALEEAMSQVGAPGAQAAIVFQDGTAWSGAAGQSVPDRSMTPELLMPIASVTKVYTAVLVLRLVGEGLLSLDDQVTRWLPDATTAAGATIRQLLTHTSGVASDDPALPPVCAPGACYSYSNGGYQLLGRIIEAATGGTYAAALRERILAPLRLDSTFYPREEEAVGDEAIGHRRAEEQRAIDAATFAKGPGWLGASGGIVATAQDTAWFADALFAGRVLPEEGLRTLTDVEVTRGLPGTIDCDASAMLGRRGTNFGEAWTYGGNAGWFRAWFQHYATHGLSVVVLVNSDAFPGPIADKLVAVALEGQATTDPGGHCEDAIAIRAPDGNVRRLPDLPGFDGMPAWSPGGASIAWLTFHDDRADVVVARTDGTELRNVTNDAAHDVRVSWSPDGNRIAFSSNRDGDFDLYVLRLADGSTVQITHDDADDWLPAWSPDGRSIAYIRTSGGNELRIVDADGGADRPVVGADNGAWWPAWAPQSDRIAYESGGVIFIVAAAGGEPVRLAVERLRVVGFPTWAPSTDLAFTSDGDLYAAAPDGSNLRRLTETPTDEQTPAWAPDRATIAFQLSFWVDGPP